MFNWLWDQSAQTQFNILWDMGTRNMADYFTKHHLPSHHKLKCHDYVLKGYNVRLKYFLTTRALIILHTG